jgi:Ni/Co efflux regulator RcnB
MRRNMQAPKHFHSGNYNAPQGYQYRHWSYGERLPRGYFARDYWISDFSMFGLFAPPSYLVWVRVGDDALLIDRDSGEIVQVRYGVFY